MSSGPEIPSCHFPSMRTSVFVFASGLAFVCPRAALDTAASDPSHHALGRSYKAAVTFPLALRRSATFSHVTAPFLLFSAQ